MCGFCWMAHLLCGFRSMIVRFFACLSCAFGSVNVMSYSPTCNCPAGQHDFESCKHVATCWHVRACVAAQAELDRIRSRALIIRPQGMAALQEAFGPVSPA